jgi:hypothetical protein
LTSSSQFKEIERCSSQAHDNEVLPSRMEGDAKYSKKQDEVAHSPYRCLSTEGDRPKGCQSHHSNTIKEYKEEGNILEPGLVFFFKKLLLVDY